MQVNVHLFNTHSIVVGRWSEGQQYGRQNKQLTGRSYKYLLSVCNAARECYWRYITTRVTRVVLSAFWNVKYFIMVVTTKKHILFLSGFYMFQTRCKYSKDVMFQTPCEYSKHISNVSNALLIFKKCFKCLKHVAANQNPGDQIKPWGCKC